uniref:Uncharacterized protein n=1 Tax=Anopheles atroparvus TaxID=41427 RepID=A0AAG5DSJ8_ANOAO
MDNFFAAISLFRRRKYDECIEVCNVLLQQNALHQGPWELKMRSMTQRVYIDDIEADDDVAGRLGGNTWGFFGMLRWPLRRVLFFPLLRSIFPPPPACFLYSAATPTPIADRNPR